METKTAQVGFTETASHTVFYVVTHRGSFDPHGALSNSFYYNIFNSWGNRDHEEAILPRSQSSAGAKTQVFD